MSENPPLPEAREQTERQAPAAASPTDAGQSQQTAQTHSAAPQTDSPLHPPDQSTGMGPWSDWRKAEGRFSGISPQRWQELLRHYAEIQQYQKAHGLQDRGDPLE